MDDANSEVTRAIEMIEAACSVSSGIVGSHLVQESGETYTIQEPLVCDDGTRYSKEADKCAGCLFEHYAI